MSGAPTPWDDIAGDLSAAEYVLGVLDASEWGAAERRQASDPAFAAEIEAWTLRFAPLIDLGRNVAPDPSVWTKITRRLDAGALAGPVNLEAARSARAARGLTFWRTATGASGALAAGLALVIAWPKPTPAPTWLASARLSSPTGAPGFVATLDPSGRGVLVIPTGATPVAGRSPELWLIPDGAQPISLGVAAFDRPVRLGRTAAAGRAGRLTLAITIEPLGGSPTGKPTGAIIASGRLERL